MCESAQYAPRAIADRSQKYPIIHDWQRNFIALTERVNVWKRLHGLCMMTGWWTGYNNLGSGVETPPTQCSLAPSYGTPQHGLVHVSPWRTDSHHPPEHPLP